MIWLEVHAWWLLFYIVGVALANALFDVLICWIGTDIIPTLSGIVYAVCHANRIKLPKKYSLPNTYFSIIGSWIIVVILIMIILVETLKRKNKHGKANTSESKT